MPIQAVFRREVGEGFGKETRTDQPLLLICLFGGDLTDQSHRNVTRREEIFIDRALIPFLVLCKASVDLLRCVILEPPSE